MRLIDADALKQYFFRPYSNEECYTNLDIEKVIDAQPTIEPKHFDTESWKTTTTDLPPVEYAPVVRCKDCKKYKAKWGTCPEVDSPLINYLKPDDFCSRGKRKDEVTE